MPTILRWTVDTIRRGIFIILPVPLLLGLI